VLIVLPSFYFRSLNVSGSIATLILGTIIFGFGGWEWAVPILSFFITSSILSKLGKSVKEQFKDTFEKTGTRDLWQVLANGSIGGFFVLIAIFDPGNAKFYFAAYTLSFAAATADTWATELGVLFKGTPVLITTFKKVKPGVSGGISFYGSLASLAGSFFIVWVASFFVPMETEIILMLGLIGFSGSLVDSLIGATIQGQYQCRVCKKYTEKKSHCNTPALKIKGFRWMTNDLVNFISILSSVLVLLLISPHV